MSLSNLIKSITGGEILLPVLRKYLIKEADLLDSGKLKHHEQVKQDALMTVKCFLDRYADYNHGTGDYEGYFHPSQVGTCQRALWYGHKGATPNESFNGNLVLRDHFTFEFGTYFGVLFQNLCERAGVLKSRESLVVCHKYKIVGHADGELLIDGREYILEIKSTNDRRFTAIQKAPNESHKKQVMTYMNVRKLKWAIILYYNKERASFKEFVIPYEESYFQKECLPRITSMQKSVKGNVPPPREGSNVRLFPCSFCEFSRICYDSELEKDFLTKLKNDSKGKPAIKGKKLTIRCLSAAASKSA
jgi:CRISPR/Cas system-associated exonuclease Cas4 (RecB family)